MEEGKSAGWVQKYQKGGVGRTHNSRIGGGDVSKGVSWEKYLYIKGCFL